MTLTLTDDHNFVTKEKVLPQGIYMQNMKVLSLTFQKLRPMLKFFAGKQMDKQTGKQTGQILHAPDLMMQGHKNVLEWSQ